MTNEPAPSPQDKSSPRWEWEGSGLEPDWEKALRSCRKKNISCNASGGSHRLLERMEIQRELFQSAVSITKS